MTTNRTPPPFLDNNWTPPLVDVEVLDSGAQILSSPRAPLPVVDSLVEMLNIAAAKFPGRNFLAQRGADDAWRYLSYADADARSSRVAQWLIDRKLPAGTPVMILSENSLENALFMFGAMKARLPVVPVSPGYSLQGGDCPKLRSIFSLVEPGVLFVQDAGAYAGALKALRPGDLPVVKVSGDCDAVPGIAFEALLRTGATDEVARSIGAIRPDDTAKILFTSGSTGEPKGVINTHRNLCFIHSSVGAAYPLDEMDPPIQLDWLPWHHTYGGNQNLHRTIRYGGTLYIDDGKPLPALFARTIRNLREIPVTTFSTVPAAYPVLLDALEKDAALRSTFYSRLRWFSYGGSDMPKSIYDRIQQVSVAATGYRYAVTTGLGSTETSALLTTVHWPNERQGNIGLPTPGTQLKLVPLGDKYELRAKGPQITPGYYKDPAKTAAAFDEDGWFRTGDAVRWIDDGDPTQGLVFAGRVAEDFKLLNGTWVHTGALRSAAISALAPLVSDLVVAGLDRDRIAVLAWLDEAGVRASLNDLETPFGELMDAASVRQRLTEALRAYNRAHDYASMRIARLLLLKAPPSPDAGEINDKRYINQRAVLARRADDVERLYAAEPDGDLIVP